MLNAVRAITKLVVPLVEAQAQKCVRTASPTFLPSIHHLKAPVRRISSTPLILSNNTMRWYASRPNSPIEQASKIGGIAAHLKETASSSIRKIFAPPGSSRSKRLLAGLNRFGPLQAINPLFMWNLQTLYRPYLTMTVSLLSSLLLLGSAMGTPDSVMRLVAIPTRYWAGDDERLFTSPFVHTHWFHYLTLSGFFLAFSTAVEVAAGPLALLAVLLSTAVVGTAASICAPERSTNLFIEKVQMGLWPSVLGLAAFFHYGIRKAAPTYIMKSPNMTRDQKVLARQLTATLSLRRVPLAVMATLALVPMPGVDSTATGALAGGLLGGVLGYMWTRSPHLVLINGLLAAAGMAYVARAPTWTLRYQAFQYAQSWEDGDFIRAREWLRLFDAHSRRLTGAQSGTLSSDWTLVVLALVEMACGRTSAALKYAESVDMDALILKRDLHRLQDEFASEWQRQSATEAEQTNTTNLKIGPYVANPSKLESLQRYRQAFQLAPWRIMNDEKIGHLFYLAFRSETPLTPPQMQELILNNYKGLFNFDPSYARGYISAGDRALKLPSPMRDNPLQ